LKLRNNLSYSNVVATLALFLALGGATAFAASQLDKNSVGSKQLKKDAVTAAKIKNGAVTQAKIATSAQNTLKGAQGPVGPQGLRGPSNGFAVNVEGNFPISATEATPTVVMSLALPAGKWMLTGETALSNLAGATRSAFCALKSGATVLGRTHALDEAPGTQKSADATVLGAVNLPSGGTVQFVCWADGNLVFVPGGGSNPAIQAIQVETLN
jgi:hypothetical protein